MPAPADQTRAARTHSAGTRNPCPDFKGRERFHVLLGDRFAIIPPGSWEEGKESKNSNRTFNWA